MLRAEQEFWRVAVPVLVEALEAVGREADGGCGGEVEVAGVEEVEERVLKDFGPDLEVFEVCAAGLRDFVRIVGLWGCLGDLQRDRPRRRWRCCRCLIEVAVG